MEATEPLLSRSRGRKVRPAPCKSLGSNRVTRTADEVGALSRRQPASVVCRAMSHGKDSSCMVAGSPARLRKHGVHGTATLAQQKIPAPEPPEPSAHAIRKGGSVTGVASMRRSQSCLERKGRNGCTTSPNRAVPLAVCAVCDAMCVIHTGVLLRPVPRARNSAACSSSFRPLFRRLMALLIRRERTVCSVSTVPALSIEATFPWGMASDAQILLDWPSVGMAESLLISRSRARDPW